MNAEIRTLYKSDLFDITAFICQCTDCGFSGIEYQNKFSICYIQRGSFLFKIYSGELECFNSRFLLNRPGFTHRVKHYHTQADECLIISFHQGMYDKITSIYRKALNGFFSKEDVHSLILQSTHETEYLIYRLKKILLQRETDGLQIDGIVFELAEKIFHINERPSCETISEKQKRNFLPAIERSREYVQEHFADSITLEELAGLSHMSVFHFNRVFRQIVHISPYQYLLNFRIHHASHLLVSSEEAIASIGWSTGFKNPDHFSYAFKGITGLSPQQYRNFKKRKI